MTVFALVFSFLAVGLTGLLRGTPAAMHALEKCMFLLVAGLGCDCLWLLCVALLRWWRWRL